ncbi:hypothetical protein B4U79_02720, partial [Dinothrombium tinctorium]
MSRHAENHSHVSYKPILMGELIAKNGLIVFYCTIRGKKTEVVLDSGGQSIINEKFWNEYKSLCSKICIYDDATIMCGSGRIVIPRLWVHFDITIGDRTFLDLPFRYIPGWAADIVLGQDLLRHCGFVLNFANNSVSFERSTSELRHQCRDSPDGVLVGRRSKLHLQNEEINNDVWTPEVKIGNSLKKEQKRKITQMLQKYNAAFSRHDMDLGEVKVDPFKLHCDASGVGVGVALMQRHDDGKVYPVAFASKKLTDVQQKYPITEQECYAINWGVNYFHEYLDGREFTVITDHSALQWLQNSLGMKSRGAKRLFRWATELS